MNDREDDILVFNAVEFDREPTDAELDAIEASSGLKWWDKLVTHVFQIYNNDVKKGTVYVAYQIVGRFPRVTED